MAKKSVKEIKVYDETTRKTVFTDAFMEALGHDGLRIHGDKLQIETKETIYVVNLQTFANVWKNSFETIYGRDFPEALQQDEIVPGMMISLYEWTNPIFEQLPIKIVAKKQFLNNFKEQMKNDENYFNKIREATFKLLGTLGLEVKKAYIDRFSELEILNEKDKIFLEYYSDETPERLAKIFEEKEMNFEEQNEVVSQAFARERKKQELSDKKSKRKFNNRIVGLINLLPVLNILDVYISGMLTEEELVRTKVTKQDLLSLPYDMLLEVLSDKNDILPETLKITSKDLVWQYGRGMRGSSIYKLAKYGYIEPEDLIVVYDTNKALEAMGYDEESLFEDEELKAFYTPDVLLNMKEKGALTPKFLEEYLALQDFENHPEVFRAKSKMLVGEVERRVKEDGDKKLEDEVLSLFDIGLCDSETARENIPESYIEEKFFEDKLTVEQIFDYYQRGLINEEAVLKYYSREELFELYETGAVSGNCLKAIKNVDFLLQRFCDGKIADYDFLRLYLEGDNLSVTDLDEGLQLAEKEMDIAGFITRATPYHKIKELFTSYLIDYSSILGLHHQGVIDDSQLEELKNALNTREFFEELQSGKTYRVVTTREGDGRSKKNPTPRPVIEKDFSIEVDLISKLLEKEVEEEPYSLIESYNAKGRATSLNNYRIFGNEDLDGIIFLQKSKKENAVYVMSALQLMYFLKGKENEEGQIEIQNRMKDKAYLKTIEGVEVVEHNEYFVNNLVEAAARISPKIAEKVKLEDEQYVAETDKMWREQYFEERKQKAKKREEEITKE
ncbi:MAG: hypothetical protein IJ867_07785 [Clostridia bacterium]|nr:hypothetical protein [Clostridia bacterium]